MERFIGGSWRLTTKHPLTWVDSVSAFRELMLRNMRGNLHRFIALCLVLIWGPATMCCALEAADLAVLCSDGTCHSDDAHAPLDGCHVLESGDYQSVIPTLKTAPPATFVCACLLCLREIEPSENSGTQLIREPDRPRDWTVTWQFERRAAAPAHAPDSLIG